MLRTFLFSAALLLAFPAIAQDVPVNTEDRPPAATRIVTDQETGTIRFIVDGREAARIDASGLHVREGIEYGGTITDAGSADYEAREAEAAKP